LDANELEHLLGLGLSDNSGTSRAGDQSDSDGAAFTSDLAGYGMRVTDFITPVTFSDGGDVGTFNGSLDFFVAFFDRVRHGQSSHHPGPQL
jgi:hypothetical protein